MTTPNPYTPEKDTLPVSGPGAVPDRPLDTWVRRGLTAVTLLPWLYTIRRAMLILLPTTALGRSWTPVVDVAVFASLLVGAVLVVARPRGARRSIGFWSGVAIASVVLGQVAYFFARVRLTERFGAPKIWPSDCHALTDVSTCQGREFTSWMEPVAGTSYSRAEGSMAPDWCRAFFEKQPLPSANPLDPPEPCDFEAVTGFVETPCNLDGMRCFECVNRSGPHFNTAFFAVTPDGSRALLMRGHDVRISEIDELLRAWPPTEPEAGRMK